MLSAAPAKFDYECFPMNHKGNHALGSNNILSYPKRFFNLYFRYSTNFLGEMGCNIVGIEFGPNNKMDIGKAIVKLSFLKELYRRTLGASQGAVFARELDVVPAMLERRFEPNARKACLLDKFAIFGNGPRPPAKRQDRGIGIRKFGTQGLRFKPAIFFDPVGIDYLSRGAAASLLYHEVKIHPATPKQIR